MTITLFKSARTPGAYATHHFHPSPLVALCRMPKGCKHWRDMPCREELATVVPRRPRRDIRMRLAYLRRFRYLMSSISTTMPSSIPAAAPTESGLQLKNGRTALRSSAGSCQQSSLLVKSYCTQPKKTAKK